MSTVIEFWAGIWKWVLLGGVGVFVLLAIVVTIGGLGDIKSMLDQLRNRPDDGK